MPASVLSVTPVAEPPKVCVFTSSLSPLPAMPMAQQPFTGVLTAPAVMGDPAPLDAVPIAPMGLDRLTSE